MSRILPVNINMHFVGNSSPARLLFLVNVHQFLITIFFILSGIIACTVLSAQQASAPDTAYQRVIKERSTKIVHTLEITNSTQFDKVTALIATQYFQLNSIHDASKVVVTGIKAQVLSKEEINTAVKLEEEKKGTALKQLHGQFIAQLKETLTDAQVDKVKDGMTYSILPVTWKAYMDMLPNLTQEQKDKMYNWLLEARELAMDEGSSNKKHEVFGKYKGRINNYLSAAGYDMKKEGEAWQQRIKEREAAKKQNPGV